MHAGPASANDAAAYPSDRGSVQTRLVRATDGGLDGTGAILTADLLSIAAKKQIQRLDGVRS
jgi:hypothetical protein